MLDPEEYRWECRDVAKAATDADAKAQFLRSAAMWHNLASDILAQTLKGRA